MNEEFKNEEIVEDRDPDFYIKKGFWKDMEYLNIILKETVETVVCIGDKRFVLRGKVALGRVENHPPWEDQFQIQFYCTEPIREEARVHNKWNTIGFNFSLEKGLKLLSVGLSKLKTRVTEKDWREMFAVEEKSEKRS